MNPLGLEEYLEACKHWFEMYEAFVECMNYERDFARGAMKFSLSPNLEKVVGYKDIHCSYCQILEVRKRRQCCLCLLSDVQCNDEDSPWEAFNQHPSKHTAKNMLLAILIRKPNDYPQTKEEFLNSPEYK